MTSRRGNLSITPENATSTAFTRIQRTLPTRHAVGNNLASAPYLNIPSLREVPPQRLDAPYDVREDPNAVNSVNVVNEQIQRRMTGLKEPMMQHMRNVAAEADIRDPFSSFLTDRASFTNNETVAAPTANASGQVDPVAPGFASLSPSIQGRLFDIFDNPNRRALNSEETRLLLRTMGIASTNSATDINYISMWELTGVLFFSHNFVNANMQALAALQEKCAEEGVNDEEFTLHHLITSKQVRVTASFATLVAMFITSARFTTGTRPTERATVQLTEEKKHKALQILIAAKWDGQDFIIKAHANKKLKPLNDIWDDI